MGAYSIDLRTCVLADWDAGLKAEAVGPHPRGAGGPVARVGHGATRSHARSEHRRGPCSLAERQGLTRAAEKRPPRRHQTTEPC